MTMMTFALKRKYATKTKCKILFASYSKFSEREMSKALLYFTLATPTCSLPSVCLFSSASFTATVQCRLYYACNRMYVTQSKHFLFRMRFTKRTHEEEEKEHCRSFSTFTFTTINMNICCKNMNTQKRTRRRRPPNPIQQNTIQPNPTHSILFAHQQMHINAQPTHSQSNEMA